MPKGPRKFHFSFESNGLTRYGGLSLFLQFCKYIRLRHFLQLYVRWPRYSSRTYHPADLFLTHIFAIVAGIERIEGTQSLTHNGLIPPLLGFNEFPHRDTLRTFLRRYNETHLHQVQAAHDRLRERLLPLMGIRYSAIVDADTTALMTYGHQEGVAVGYVPKRRHGGPSYSPILSSEGNCGLTLAASLRSGSTHSVTGALAFLEPVLEKFPSTVASSRIRVRLDGGFYDKAIIQALDERDIGYAMVARMTRPLREEMVSVRYHEFAEGWEAAEFQYTPFHWKEPHRFVAIRRPAALEPEGIQQRLFTFKRHTYRRVLATNLPLTPAAVYRFYCHRGFQELLLRELKNAYSMVSIPTRSYWANAVYLEMILWAYDLVQAFQYFCLPKEIQHWNISTLRRNLWWLPAQWVRRDNRNVLLLPAKYPQAALFETIRNNISNLKPIFGPDLQ